MLFPLKSSYFSIPFRIFIRIQHFCQKLRIFSGFYSIFRKVRNFRIRKHFDVKNTKSPVFHGGYF